MNDTRQSLTDFLGARYWPLWLSLGLIRAISTLPYPAQKAIGRGLGRLGLMLGGERKRIAERNLQLCFPDMTEQQRSNLVRAHFESLGIAIFETGMTWWSRPHRVAALGKITGLEHVEQALAKGKGVILLSAHFTTLEISSCILALQVPLHAVYRPHRNGLLDEIMRRGRERSAAGTIPKADIRQMVRALRKNQAVWYAPDQAHLSKGAEQVPLFGVAAFTNVATSRLAKLTGAPVLPFLPWRTAQGYQLEIGPPLENFPSGDDVADAALFHRLVEERVRQVPEQYLWIHRRFKKPGSDVYAANAQRGS